MGPLPCVRIENMVQYKCIQTLFIHKKRCLQTSHLTMEDHDVLPLIERMDGLVRRVSCDFHRAYDEVEVGRGNKIPLWLFGFLY